MSKNLVETQLADYPDFAIKQEFGETHYLLSTSKESGWIDVGRDAYVAALETRRLSRLGEIATTLEGIAHDLRIRNL